MRDFTPAERALTAGLLGHGPVGLRSDPRVRALSRRTRQTALGRIYLRRWIEEVVLPNPIVLGNPWSTIALVRPYAEQRAAVEQRWMERPELVHLWSAPDLLLGIHFSRTETAAKELRAAIDDPAAQSHAWFLTFDITRWPIPVYFDFEGVWARLHGGGPARYPRSLPVREPTGAGSGPERFPGLDRATMSEILDRPAVAEDGGLVPRARPSWRAQRATRRWSELGWLERRAFLDPTAVHRWITSFPPRIAWVHADLRPGVSPHALFLALGHDAGIAPFFYATDGTKVVLGTLSTGEGGGATARAEGGPSVLTTLEQRASSIVIVRENLDELRTPVFHDFGRLLRAARAGPGAGGRPGTEPPARNGNL